VTQMQQAEQTKAGFRFIISEGQCVIRRYEGNQTRVQVPETLGGAPVRRIGSGAFLRQSDLTEVLLPDSVEIIDHHAFAGCTSLVRLSPGHGLLALGSRCLEGCISLKELALPVTLRMVMEGAFAGCSALKTVTLPTGAMVALAPGIFDGCVTLSLPHITLTRGEADALPGVATLMTQDDPSALREIRLGRCYAEPHRAVMTFVCAGMLRGSQNGPELLSIPEAEWILEQIG